MDNKQQDQEQAQDQEQVEVEVEVQQQVELQDQVQEQEVEKSFITDDTNTNEPSLGGDGSGSIESSDELLEVVKNALNK